jgi:hypothetical protein
MIGETREQQQKAQGRQDWYEVEIEGSIDPKWFDGLNGWGITLLANGNTLLSGWIRDQPALHGLFARIRDLNLKIISLRECVRPQSDETQGTKKQD